MVLIQSTVSETTKLAKGDTGFEESIKAGQ